MQAATLVVFILLVLAQLEAALSCGEHDHTHAHAQFQPSWVKTLEVKGRSRSLLSLRGRRCGTEDVHPEVQVQVEVQHQTWRKKEAVRKAKEAARVGGPATRIYNIPVFVTVVMSDDGLNLGNVTDKAINAQLEVIKNAYGGASAAAQGVQWKFQLKRIKRISGPTMCDKANEARIKTAQRTGGASTLNLYFTDLSDCGLLGFSTWPWSYKSAPTQDGVVIHFDTMPGGQYIPYNLGASATHEIGHWLGLYHTFQNGCVRGGDMVDDTPYTSTPTNGCPAQKDTCSAPGVDPIHNFMDYSDDSCMSQITAGQHQRMEGQWSLFRATGK